MVPGTGRKSDATGKPAKSGRRTLAARLATGSDGRHPKPV
jgi:hypothetical protein